MLPMATGVCALLLSYLLVGVIRNFASYLSLLDFPNPRSSHAVPTPRGGGAGAVVATLSILVGATLLFASDWRLLLALLGVAVTALTGWTDDRDHFPVAARLAAHLVSGCLLLPLALDGSTSNPLIAVLLGAW